MNTIFLCVYDFALIKEVIEYENKNEDIRVAGIATTIHEDVEKLIDMKVDVLVFQLSDDYTLCTRVLSRIRANPLLHDMRMILMLKEMNMFTINLLVEFNIDNFIIAPYSLQQLITTIHKEHERKAVNDVSKWNMDTLVTKTIIDLGIPIHLNGFHYLRTCSLLSAQHYGERKLPVGKLYEECARIHETTTQRIEKSIRTAVNYAFRTQPEKICIYNVKPTNSQIIIYISEKLKLFNAA